MDEIKDLQRLAGIHEFKGYSEYQIDENPSITATQRKQQERERGIKPGDDEWFKLWFSKPFMTGPVNFRGRRKK